MGFANKQLKATYQCFMDMKQRCQNKNHKYYASYGDRGIDVSDSWQSFENFVCTWQANATSPILNIPKIRQSLLIVR